MKSKNLCEMLVTVLYVYVTVIFHTDSKTWSFTNRSK